MQWTGKPLQRKKTWPSSWPKYHHHGRHHHHHHHHHHCHHHPQVHDDMGSIMYHGSFKKWIFSNNLMWWVTTIDLRIECWAHFVFHPPATSGLQAWATLLYPFAKTHKDRVQVLWPGHAGMDQPKIKYRKQNNQRWDVFNFGLERWPCIWSLNLIHQCCNIIRSMWWHVQCITISDWFQGQQKTQ